MIQGGKGYKSESEDEEQNLPHEKGYESESEDEEQNLPHEKGGKKKKKRPGKVGLVGEEMEDRGKSLERIG